MGAAAAAAAGDSNKARRMVFPSFREWVVV